LIHFYKSLKDSVCQEGKPRESIGHIQLVDRSTQDTLKFEKGK